VPSSSFATVVEAIILRTSEQHAISHCSPHIACCTHFLSIISSLYTMSAPYSAASMRIGSVPCRSTQLMLTLAAAAQRTTRTMGASMLAPRYSSGTDILQLVARRPA
jgi:hypothetical protein